MECNKWLFSQVADFFSRLQGYAADFTRAYLTNVCVANELQRKGIGSALVMQSVKIAQQWGNVFIKKLLIDFILFNFIWSLCQIYVLETILSPNPFTKSVYYTVFGFADL